MADLSIVEDATAGTEAPEPGVICTVCVHVNPPHRDYCAHCGALMNTLTSFSPFEQTLLEGFAYRRAVEGPPSKILLVGMWMLFLPGLIILPLSLVAPYTGGLDGETIGWSRGQQVAIFLFSAVVLYRTTANFLTKRRQRPAEDAESAA